MFVESCNTCRFLLLCPPTSTVRSMWNESDKIERVNKCWSCIPNAAKNSVMKKSRMYLIFPLNLSATESASFIIILHLCEGSCVVSLGVATSAIWKFCDSPGDLGKAVCSQNFNVKQKDTKYGFRNSCALHGSVAFHIFHTFHHSSSVLWNMLNSASLLCTVWKGRKSYSSNQSGQFHSHANLYTVLHNNFSGLLKHWFVRQNIIEIDACHTLPHLCFWSFSRTSVKNSRLPLWLRRALQTFWAQHPRKMCGDAPGRSVGTKQH